MNKITINSIFLSSTLVLLLAWMSSISIASADPAAQTRIDPTAIQAIVEQAEKPDQQAKQMFFLSRYHQIAEILKKSWPAALPSDPKQACFMPGYADSILIIEKILQKAATAIHGMSARYCIPLDDPENQVAQTCHNVESGVQHDRNEKGVLERVHDFLLSKEDPINSRVQVCHAFSCENQENVGRFRLMSHEIQFDEYWGVIVAAQLRIQGTSAELLEIESAIRDTEMANHLANTYMSIARAAGLLAGAGQAYSSLTSGAKLAATTSQVRNAINKDLVTGVIQNSPVVATGVSGVTTSATAIGSSRLSTFWNAIRSGLKPAVSFGSRAHQGIDTVRKPIQAILHGVKAGKEWNAETNSPLDATELTRDLNTLTDGVDRMENIADQMSDKDPEKTEIQENIKKIKKYMLDYFDEIQLGIGAAGTGASVAGILKKAPLAKFNLAYAVIGTTGEIIVAHQNKKRQEMIDGLTKAIPLYSEAIEHDLAHVRSAQEDLVEIDSALRDIQKIKKVIPECDSLKAELASLAKPIPRIDPPSD